MVETAAHLTEHVMPRLPARGRSTRNPALTTADGEEKIL
jgi:hypothetical protein